jgi:hypothetical protein
MSKPLPPSPSNADLTHGLTVVTLSLSHNTTLGSLLDFLEERKYSRYLEKSHWFLRTYHWYAIVVTSQIKLNEWFHFSFNILKSVL